jgi:hypothetical protein
VTTAAKPPLVLTPKQRIQYEIIDIDDDLWKLAHKHPSSKPTISRIRNVLGLVVHLLDGCDVREFCSVYTEREA